jgi:hypothetical protein
MSTDGAGSTVGNYSAGENALGQVLRSVDIRWKPFMALLDIYNQGANKTTWQ